MKLVHDLDIYILSEELSDMTLVKLLSTVKEVLEN